LVHHTGRKIRPHDRHHGKPSGLVSQPQQYRHTDAYHRGIQTIRFDIDPGERLGGYPDSDAGP
jgi:hypothetical protein